MEIDPLKPALCDQAARLHMRHLSTPFRGTAGRRLLTCYYQAVCLGKGASGYMAQRDGELLGYVCGLWDSRELRTTLLRTHGLAVAWWGFLQVASNPSMLPDFIRRFRSVNQTGDHAERNDHHTSYELRPIVVSPGARGSGLALRLVEQLIQDARLRGFRSIHLYTEQDNMAAQRFYERVGFHETGRTVLQEKAHFHFELAIA